MFTYDLTDEDYELPYNRPGKSSSYFELDDEVGRGRTKHRADVIKLETILGNSGDMDLDYVGGPTGLGEEPLDKGLRAYQKRNGLKVDGWARPGGPTITKMKEQFGSLLGDYQAPSPRQSDTHHRMRDAGFPGFLKPKRQDLLMPPIPGLPAPSGTILGANHSLVRTVRDGGMQDVAGWMAQRVRSGGDGVVEARNFVDQLDGLMPGEGTKAIRGILQRLADTPALQRQFFGGPVIELAPVGVFEPDGPQRYEEALKTKPWEEYELGRKRPDQGPIRDMAWRPDRDGGDPNHQTRPYQQVSEEVRQKHNVPRDAGAGGEPPPHNDGLLDPSQWPAHLRGGDTADQTEGLQGEATATDKDDETAHAIQIAQAQGRQPAPPTPIPPQEPFRGLLATRESENRIDASNVTKGNDRNPQEVLGLYQLSRDILVDAGLKNRDGSWREGNAAGVSSDAEFLKNREAQDKALALVLGVYSRQVQSAGADRIIGQQIAGIRAQITVTESGLIAAAHRGGIGNLQTYIKRMEANGWDSQRAYAGIAKETDDPKERKVREDWHKRIETRLREFGPVNLR